MHGMNVQFGIEPMMVEEFDLLAVFLARRNRDRTMKSVISISLLLLPLICSGTTVEWDSTFVWSGIKRGYFDIVHTSTLSGSQQRELMCVKDGWQLIAAEMGIEVEALAPDLFNVTFYTESYMSYRQCWTVAQSGDVVGYDTIRNLDESQYIINITQTGTSNPGPTQLTMERDIPIYLAFMCNEGYPENPAYDYYGWVQLAIDGNGNPVVLDSACDFSYGPMIVGGGAYTGGIPEPSGGMLMLLGLAALGLRRKEYTCKRVEST